MLFGEHHKTMIPAKYCEDKRDHDRKSLLWPNVIIFHIMNDMYMHLNVHGPEVNTQEQCKEIILKSQVRQNALSSVRSRSTTTRKAGNLATILIVIGKMINHCIVIVISHVKYLIFVKLVFLVSKIKYLQFLAYSCRFLQVLVRSCRFLYVLVCSCRFL